MVELTILAVTGAVAAAALALVAHLMKHAVCVLQRDMRGEVVLVTGSGGGLGRHLALELAGRGCALALVDVTEAANEETAAQVRALAPALPVRTYTVDLGDRKAVVDLVARVLRDFGHVDVLLSNAAILLAGGVCDNGDDAVDDVLAVNLRATVLLVRGLLPQMRARRRGQVVAVSSVAGLVPHHAMGLYGAAKAGLTHFMQCLYRELRVEGLERDILVTTIHPYFMSTFDILVHAHRVSGWLRWITPLLEPARAARRAVEAVARGERYLVIPDHMKLLTTLLTLLPVCLQDFALEKCVEVTFRYLPPYQFRHAARDVHLLHEFLVRGHEPFADPAPLLRAMHDECVSADRAPPYDFRPFRGPLREYYASRGQSVPAVVEKYTSEDNSAA